MAGTGELPCGMVEQQLIALVRNSIAVATTGVLVIDRFVEDSGVC